MESPPSSSTWSEAFILSDDSGLLLTNESASSNSVSFESKSGKKLIIPFEDSDCEEKSLSQDDSLDDMSHIMCGENYSTLKKGPNWIETNLKAYPIEPPPEFQDKPRSKQQQHHEIYEYFSDKLSKVILKRAFNDYKEYELKRNNRQFHQYRPLHHLLARPSYWSPDFIPFSPCHHHMVRPSSRCSLGSSRLSSSHNSLSVPMAQRVDDSTFITQAVSHDTLSANHISDLYTVPFDSDVYAVPIDVIKPPLKPKRIQQHKKRRRNTSSGCRELDVKHCKLLADKKKNEWSQYNIQSKGKRHSVAGSSTHIPTNVEPIHMTLQEVRQYLQTLYSSSSDSSDHKEKLFKPKTSILVTNNNKYQQTQTNLIVRKDVTNTNNNININNNRTKKNAFLISIKNKKVKDSCDNNVGKQLNNNNNNNNNNNVSIMRKEETKRKKVPTKLLSFKQTLCNMFRFKRFNVDTDEHNINTDKAERNNICEKYTYGSSGNILDDIHNNITSRALPPLPLKDDNTEMDEEEQVLDFATSIQKVKDYGWYWGPISSEAAEKILSNEPDGSFIVRDSSDDHYIFSLTFKLNNCVRHVRIDHDQGNFSFGSCTKFKSQTIVEFIENAVEHSRSGRYLFFLHRRPVIGPVRVQLLHPVSRFKQIQSLQHMCRFVIHKVVRRDLIPNLPLPRRMIDYLNTPHYYSEHFVDVDENCSEDVPNRQTITPTVNNIRENQENVQQSIINLDVPGTYNYVIVNNSGQS